MNTANIQQIGDQLTAAINSAKSSQQQSAAELRATMSQLVGSVDALLPLLREMIRQNQQMIEQGTKTFAHQAAVEDRLFAIGNCASEIVSSIGGR